jgi:hypothetical protein
MAKSVIKSFEATLERREGRLGWVVIRIPFDVARVWGKRGQLKVRGDINGFAFRTSLFPTGEGEHLLLVNKRMQAGAKVSVGSEARFRLEPDTEVRTVELPEEIEQVFAEERVLKRWFDQLNYSTRRYICEWVTEVKSAEARRRRADQLTERLLSVMDAERELPPILRVAFARYPLAEEGWRRMSPSHRRGHLFAIFYYRDPEARARRVAKTIEDAHQFAKRA